MRFEINYWLMLLFISVIWAAVRIITAVKNRQFSVKNEIKMLMVYVCIAVIARIVYFPWHHVNGRIGPLVFDSSKPLNINYVPVKGLLYEYDGWKRNLYGNIAMFIPVGIVWPFCFRKLDSFGKTVLAGFVLSLFIELSQLPFYERCSDVDDLLLNTSGAAIGAAVYFICRLVLKNKKKKHSMSYYKEKALKIIRQQYPDADYECITDRYEIGYWNDEECFIDKMASYEYPGTYYPGPISVSGEEMIDILVNESIETVQKKHQKKTEG